MAHSEGEAPHLCWKTGSCSELCQYCYAHPRERSSAALVPGHSWGGGGGQGFGYIFSLSYVTLYPSRSPSGYGSWAFI